MSEKLLSQQEDHVWVLGDKVKPYLADSLYCMMAMDFNGDQVTIKPVEPCISSISGANSSIADKHGQLRAFTNGMYISDADQKYLVDTIGYDWSIPEICRDWEYNNYIYSDTAPMPNPNGKVGVNNVILFSIDSVLFAVYTLVDYCRQESYKCMYTMHHASGRTLYRDEVLSSSFVPHMAVYAVRHGNGRDWWVITLSKDSRMMVVYLADESGIRHHHTQQIENDLTYEDPAVGQIAVSPDGTKLAWMAGYYYDKTDGSQFFVADFDRCDGTVYNEQYRYVTSSGLGAGIAFSQDGRYLYTALAKQMYRYDLTRPDALDAGTLIAEYDGFTFLDYWNCEAKVNFNMLKLGPDGRMYVFASSAFCRYIGVIHHPDESLQYIDHRPHSLLTPRPFFRTVPNLPEYRLGPLDGSPCDTLGIDNHPVAKYRYEPDTTDYRHIRFTDLSYFRPETWSWDFGDGSARSSERHPRHTYALNGTYTVCLTVSNEIDSHTTCRTLTIGPSSTGDAGTGVTAAITLYPNPVEDLLLVTLGEYIPESGVITIYDISGRQVAEHVVRYGHNTLDLSRLAAGTYLWVLRDKGLRLGTGRMVKQ